MSSEIHLMPSWRFLCDAHDTLLILKALGGRLDESDTIKARDLGDKLTLERAKQGQQMQDGLERAAAAARAKAGKEGP